MPIAILSGSRPAARIQVVILVAVLALAPVAVRAQTMIQYFESRWETIERRMPDIFSAGYTAMWVPPTGLADTGGFSVGYDVFDRFDKGSAFNQTLYGTDAQLRAFLGEAHQANIAVFIDCVLNHNGFRTNATPGFEDSGGYPGFVTTLPGDLDGDFHGAFEGGVLNGRLAGLIDIAQEKNNLFIRHPVEPGNPDNIPNEIPTVENRRYYPDTDFLSPAWLGDTSGDRHTPSGFNLDNPLAGDPVVENATGLLTRYVAYMQEVYGVAGFRLDAMKHIPTWFFTDFYDPALAGKGEGGATAFSFGEIFDGDFGLLSSYTRKDGFANRDQLDFPLYFTMRDILNAGGFGDMSRLEFASFDGSDGDANDGSRGVTFVQNHDTFGPNNDNLAYAHILTRTGFPVVYFNAQEFGDARDFPKGGRGDALGGQFGDTLTELVDLRRRFARGAHRTRYIDGDVYIYERSNALLVGLNDNLSFDATRSISNLDFRNATLLELTGNPGASPAVAVDGSGNATVTIPAGSYAAWSLPTPLGSGSQTPFEISPLASVIPPDDVSVPNGIRRITPIDVVTADNATLTLRLEPEGLDDLAILRVNDGSTNILSPPTSIGGGEFPGFQEFNNADPSASGGSGVYSANLDLTLLPEGNNYIEAYAFLQRPGGLPALFSRFTKVIHVDRTGPDMSLRFPTQSGSADVLSKEYEIVLDNPDRTADSVHVLIDFAGDDAAAIAAVTGDNRAMGVDRGEFRFNWTNIAAGLHELTVVAFEPTGNVSVERFGNIMAETPAPEVEFQNLPSPISTPVYDNIQVRVNLLDPLGGPDFYFDPTTTTQGAFSIDLIVDGVTYPAQPQDPGLFGSENTFYQGDLNLTDDFDVFRFNWRAYGPGFHTFEVRARLNDGSRAESILNRSVEVAEGIAGPDFTIVDPAPVGPGQTPSRLLIDPDRIAVQLGEFSPLARSATAFIQLAEAEQQIAAASFGELSTGLTLESFPDAIQFVDGVASIRAVVTTSPDGDGIAAEKSTSVLIFGAEDTANDEEPIVVDGQDNDWIGAPPSTAHTTAVDNGEWIYTGAAGDMRTDLGDLPIGEPNDPGDRTLDLTELRIRPSAEFIYFLVRLDEVADVRRASFAIAIDTNTPGDATSIGFIGDESQTDLDTSGNTFDYTVQVHFTNESSSRVEIFDDTNSPPWYSPPGEASFISSDRDLIEFAIPRATLGLTDDVARTISIQAATFENQLIDTGGPENIGWNNDVDSTRDFDSTPDAADVVGGEPGVENNAWDRVFADGNGVLDNPDPNVNLIFDVEIPSPADSQGDEGPRIVGVSPPTEASLGLGEHVPATITTNDEVSAVVLAVGGRLVGATLTGEAGGERTWSATSAALEFGPNQVDVLAYRRPSLSGAADRETLNWIGRPPNRATAPWTLFN